MRSGLQAIALWGVAISGLASMAWAGPLRDAAAIVGANDPQGRTRNDNVVPFNRIYRINPHNTYNPHRVQSLASALEAGARVLEIDIYNAEPYPVTD